MHKEFRKMKLTDIIPYSKNPRDNSGAVDAIAQSIEQCGYLAPIVVDENLVILAGHTRQRALLKLGRETADVVIVDGLTDEQKRKYRLLDNKTAELAEWDIDLLAEELAGLDFGDLDLDWFSDDDITDYLGEATRNGIRDDAYDEFEKKFEPKLTTDDCYTPELVYEAAKNWAVEEYGWKNRKIVRPFYPGGDYKNEKYPTNSVVIDNPPFSIISEIVGFYEDNGIDYFLFAPALTTMGIRRATSRILLNANVTYANGAVVSTSFVASTGATIRSAPALYEAIIAADHENRGPSELPKYTYPANLMTATRVAAFSKYGVDYQEDITEFVRELDAQKGTGKAIFGGGFIVPEAAAREAAAREAAAREAAAREAAIEKARALGENVGEYTFEYSERESRKSFGS